MDNTPCGSQLITPVRDVRRIPLAVLARQDDTDGSLVNVLPDTRPGIVPTAAFNSSI